MAFILFLIIVVFTAWQPHLMREDKTRERLRKALGATPLGHGNRAAGPTP
jgi:hypothetical protein